MKWGERRTEKVTGKPTHFKIQSFLIRHSLLLGDGWSTLGVSASCWGSIMGAVSFHQSLDPSSGEITPTKIKGIHFT